MNVGDVLIESFDDVAPLRQPVLVLALRGWFDAAEAATGALNHLLSTRHGVIAASIDPDPFFDFTQERPVVTFDDAELRRVIWPANEFHIVRNSDSPHDIVVLNGVEPHLRFETFAACVLAVYQRLGCTLAVTVGAAHEAVPHTRLPTVIGSSSSPALANALGLSRPRYQGVTGVAGVLQHTFDAADIPAVSLRVGVPHYLSNAQHPQSSIALLSHLGHVLSMPIDVASLSEDVERWRYLHDEAVADDDQARHYVAMLETSYDQAAEQSVPSADDLAAELERFLRDRPDEGNESESR